MTERKIVGLIALVARLVQRRCEAGLIKGRPLHARGGIDQHELVLAVGDPTTDERVALG